MSDIGVGSYYRGLERPVIRQQQRTNTTNAVLDVLVFFSCVYGKLINDLIYPNII